MMLAVSVIAPPKSSSISLTILYLPPLGGFFGALPPLGDFFTLPRKEQNHETIY